LSVVAAAQSSVPSGALVTVTAVTKEFRQGQNQVRALEDVSLTIGQAEFVTIVGASGCGKTTLLSMMAGLVDPTSGTIAKDPRVSRRGGVGMVFQSPVLLPWRNVTGNVLAPAEIYGMDKKQAQVRATELLTQVELRGFEKSMPYQLSGGMQQRVAICRALLSDPPLLLMDEPFGALDALTRERMNLELQRIFLMGDKTVVLVTHSIEEAVFLSDRVIAMTPRPGRIAEEIRNELPRPRTVDTYESHLFTEYCGHVRKLVMGPGAQAIAA